ncbi:unnamed protein product, partial [Meganyctiphanes norvegica]
FSDEIDPLLTDGILTFMDIAFPMQESRRIYMKMLGNTDRARQHLLFVTGHCGHSYKGLSFKSFPDEGNFLTIEPYDGKNAEPLLKDVSVTDVVDHEVRVGLMCGAASENGDPYANNALFGVYLYDAPGEVQDSVFGQVTSGIEILHDIAKSEQTEKIKVVDCGVVVSW